MNHKLISLLALTTFALAACAPQATQPPPAAAAPQQDSAKAESAAPAATDSAAPSAPAAVPTSRGDNLQATDPATVQLASGGLQLVEFFRFT